MQASPSVTESKTDLHRASAHSAVKYDLIGRLVEDTQLTRRTVAAVLQGINKAVFSQYKTNPEDFMQKAARLINEQKATVIVEHLAYDPVEDSFDLDIFTADDVLRLVRGSALDRFDASDEQLLAAIRKWLKAAGFIKHKRDRNGQPLTLYSPEDDTIWSEKGPAARQREYLDRA